MTTHSAENSNFPEDFTLESAAFMDARLLDQLDDIKNLCVSFAENPIGKNAQFLTEAAAAHLNSVRISLDHMDDGTNSVKNIDSILNYVKGLEKQRVKFLNEIDKEDYDSYNMVDEDYDELREHLMDGCDEPESVAAHALRLYQTSMQIDMNQLSAISALEYEKNPAVKRKEMLKKFGLQALDVAKVSLGVFIGVAAAKKSKLL